MRVKYCCNGDGRAYDQYYAGQSGGGLPVFYGARMQRGHGLGSILSGLFRSVFPFLKGMAPAVGRKILTTGMQIAGDVVKGQPLNESLKTRVSGALDQGINKINSWEGAQSGSGFRRRRRPKKKKTALKKRKLDIFQ